MVPQDYGHWEILAFNSRSFTSSFRGDYFSSVAKSPKETVYHEMAHVRDHQLGRGLEYEPGSEKENGWFSYSIITRNEVDTLGKEISYSATRTEKEFWAESFVYYMREIQSKERYEILPQIREAFDRCRAERRFNTVTKEWEPIA